MCGYDNLVVQLNAASDVTTAVACAQELVSRFPNVASLPIAKKMAECDPAKGGKREIVCIGA